MKKILFLILIISTLTLTVSCTDSSSTDVQNETLQTEQTVGKYKDGDYTAEEDSYDEKGGYKDSIEITVENGYITKVLFNGYDAEGHDKITESQPGGSYDMSSAGATETWATQSSLLSEALIASQDPNSLQMNTDGYTDAVAGVTIKIDNFVVLANEALADALK